MMPKKNCISTLTLFLIAFLVNGFVVSAEGSDLKERIKELKDYVIVSKQSARLQELFDLCGESYRKGDYQKAEECAEEILLIDPKNKEAEKYLYEIRRIGIGEREKEKTRQVRTAKETKQAEKLRKKKQKKAELQTKREAAQAKEEAKQAEKLRKKKQKKAERQDKREAVQAKKEANQAEKLRKKKQKKVERQDKREAVQAKKEADQVEKIRKQKQRKAKPQVKLEAGQAKAEAEKAGLSELEGFQTKIGKLDQLLTKRALEEEELIDRQKELKLQLMSIARDEEIARNAMEDIYSALEVKGKTKQKLLWQQNETAVEISKAIAEQKNTEKGMLNAQNSLEREKQILEKLGEKTKPARLGLSRVNFEIADSKKRISGVEKSIKFLESDFFNKQQIILKAKEEKGRAFLKILSKEKNIQEEVGSLKNKRSGKDQEKEKVLEEQRKALIELSELDSKRDVLKEKILEQEALLENERLDLENVSKGYKNAQDALVSLKYENEDLKQQISETKRKISILEKKQAKKNVLIKGKRRVLKSSLKHVLIFQKESQAKINRFKKDLAQEELNKEKRISRQEESSQSAIQEFDPNISQISSRLNREKKKQGGLIREQTRIEEELDSLSTEKEALANQIADSTVFLAGAEKKLTLLEKDNQVQEYKLFQLTSQCRESQQKVVMINRLIDKIWVQEAEIASQEKKLTSRLGLLQKELQTLKNKGRDFLAQRKQAEEEQFQAVDKEKAFITALSEIEKNIELIDLNISQVSSQLDQEKKKQDGLTREQTGIEEELYNFNAEKKAFTNQMTDSIASLAEVEEKLTLLKNDKQVQESKLSRLTSQHQESQQKVAMINRLIDKIWVQEAEIASQEKKLTSRLGLLQKELQTLKNKGRDFLAQRKQAEKAQALKREKAFIATLSEIEKDIEFSSLNISQISSQLDQEKKKQDRLIREQAGIEEELYSLNTEKEVLVNQIIDSIVSLAGAEEKLTLLKKDKRVQENKLSRLTFQCRESQQKIDKINRFVDKTRLQAEQPIKQEKLFQTELETLVKNGENIRTETARLTDLFSEAKNIYDELTIAKDSLKIKGIKLTQEEENIKSQINEVNKILKGHQAADRKISTHEDSSRLRISSIESEIKNSNSKLLKLKVLMEEKRKTRQVLVDSKKETEIELAEVLSISKKIGKKEISRLLSLLKTKKNAERKIILQERKMQDEISKLSPEKEVDKRIALTKLAVDKEAAQKEIVNILNELGDKKSQASQAQKREKAFIITLSGIEKNIELIDANVSQVSSRLDQEKKKQDEFIREQAGIEEELHSLSIEKEALISQIAESIASLAAAEEKLTLLKKDKQAQESKFSQLTSQCRESQKKIAILKHLIDKTRVQEAEIVSEEKKLTNRLDLLQKELQTFKNKGRDFLAQRKQAEEEQSQAQKREKASITTLSGIEKDIELGSLNISQVSSRLDHEKKKQGRLTWEQAGIEEELYSLSIEKEALISQITESIDSLAGVEEKLTLLKKDKQAQESKLSRLAPRCRESHQKIATINRFIDKVQIQEAEIASEEKNLANRLDLLQKELQTFKNKGRDFLAQRKQAEKEQSQALEREKASIATLSGIEKDIELIGPDISQISSRLDQEKKKQDRLARKQTGIEEKLYSFNIKKEAFTSQIAESIASLAAAEEKLTLLKKDKQAQESELSRLTSQCREPQQKVAMLNRLVDKTWVQAEQPIKQEKLLQTELEPLVKKRKDIRAEIETLSRSLDQEKSLQNKLSLEKSALTEEIAAALIRQQQGLQGSIEAEETGLESCRVETDKLIQKQQSFKSSLKHVLIFQKESQAKINRFKKDLAQEELNKEKERSLQEEKSKNVTREFDLSISQISSRIDQKKKKQDGLIWEQARIEEELNSLSTEKEAIASQIAESIVFIAGAEEKLTLLKKDNQVQEYKLFQLTSRRKESQQKVVKQNRVVDKIQAQDDQLIRQEKAFKADLDDLKKDERVIQKEEKEIDASLASCIRRLEGLTIQKRGFEGRVEQLLREKEIIKGNINELNKLIRDQKAQVAELGKKQERFEFEISEKEAKIYESQKNIIDSGKFLEESEIVLEKLKEKEKLLREELPKIRENLKDIGKEISPIQNDLESARENHKKVKEREAPINIELGNLETSLAIVHKRLIDWGEEKWGLELRIVEDKRKKEFAKIEKAEREVARANQEMKEILSEKRKKVLQWGSGPTSKKEERIIYHYNRAFELDYSERYYEAAVEYEEVLKINPNDADGHYNLALIYDDHLNEKRKAIQHYQEYLELKPTTEDATEVAGWIIKARQALEWDSWK